MQGENTAIWNLVQYLLVRWQLPDGSAAKAALILGGAFLCIAVAYLLGSLNAVILIAKAKYGEDIREFGSGDAQPSDLKQRYGIKSAVVAVVLDILKTAAAYWFGVFLFFGFTGGAIAGFFAVFGHIFPIFFKFRGGKGVICFATVACLTNPIVFAVSLFVWAVVAFGTRFVSLSSVMAVMIYPLLLRAIPWNGAGMEVAMAIAAAVSVAFRHKQNLTRIYHAQEPKWEPFKKNSKSESSQKGGKNP